MELLRIPVLLVYHLVSLSHQSWKEDTKAYKLNKEINFTTHNYN